MRSSASPNGSQNYHISIKSLLLETMSSLSILKRSQRLGKTTPSSTQSHLIQSRIDIQATQRTSDKLYLFGGCGDSCRGLQDLGNAISATFPWLCIQ